MLYVFCCFVAFLCSPFLSLLVLSVAVGRCTSLVAQMWTCTCFQSWGGLSEFAARSGSRDRHRFRPPRFFVLNKDTKGNLSPPSSPRRETRTRARITPQNKPDKRKKCARARNFYLEIVQTNRAQARAPTIRPEVATHSEHLFSPLQPILALHFRDILHTLRTTTTRYIPATERNTLTTPLPGYGREGPGCHIRAFQFRNPLRSYTPVHICVSGAWENGR